MRYILLLAAALAATPALAESPFDGTWKGDLKSAKVASKPSHVVLKDGMYTCTTCLPGYTVKADGQFHAVAGKDYWDAVSVTTVDPMTVKYAYQKSGTVIATRTDTISADGKTMTSVAHNTNNGAGTPIDSTAAATRVGAAPAGAHAASGDWNVAPATSVSDNAIMLTMKVDGGMLHLTSPLGETLDAKLGGDFAPNVGDPGKTMTKVAMAGPRTIHFTDMRGGKVVGTSDYTVSTDGMTLTNKWKDPRDGSTGTYTAMKQ